MTHATVFCLLLLIAVTCVAVPTNETPTSTALTNSSRKLGCRDECAFGRMKEPFLESGYRIGYTAQDCLDSVFEVHNETASIWTHAFSFASWVVLGWLTHFRLLPRRKLTIHHLLFAMLIVPNLVSMASSVRFHTFRSIDEATYARLATTDFKCIVAVLVGTQIPQLYYVFGEWPRTRKWYLSIAAVLAVLGFAYLSVPALTHPALRVMRTLVFCSIGSIAAIATIHAGVLEWPPNKPGSRFWLHTRWITVAYLFALSAVVVYIPRFPERYWPGLFDNTLQSHVIMHLVLMAAEYSFWWHYAINYRATVKTKSD